jgi:hypothetical protein
MLLIEYTRLCELLQRDLYSFILNILCKTGLHIDSKNLFCHVKKNQFAALQRLVADFN